MSEFDITDTLAPKSAQLDAIDLRMSGPRVFTIERVTAGNAEQPLNVHLVEFDRPWRPGVNQRRVLAYCWGKDAGQWVGRRVRLFCDDSVTFGKQRPGGSRISHMSHIDGPKTVPLLVGQGQSAEYTVEPLTDAPADSPAAFDIDACESIPELRSEWKTATAAGKKRIEARVKALEAAALGSDE